MRIALIYVVLLLLVVPVATAQQKIYYTLGAKFKGLRKDQITIIPTWTYEVTRAQFVYNQQKYKAYFDQDSSLTAIAVVKNNALCPAYIKNDLNCIYRTYKIVEWVEKDYYTEGKIEYRQTEVIVSSFDEYESMEVWNYKNGIRPENGWGVEFSYGDYAPKYYKLAASEPNEGSKWYGGSFEAFQDSVKKYVKAPDLECRRKFANTKLPVYLFVNSKGEVASSGFAVAVPYQMLEQFKRFCRGKIFPVENDATTSDELYHYSFNVILSEKNEI